MENKNAEETRIMKRTRAGVGGEHMVCRESDEPERAWRGQVESRWRNTLPAPSGGLSSLSNTLPNESSHHEQ
ncbi:hypothetical protein E2C01_041461 [Portunus trituberculatus]|uniref:Uncharacterized protein n=1 Tax=Portunus trituberculatus TaxID=210409 RepID=A0A5B7FQS9_PORTR|nr:hypothetical protein [Portunus trituberculatus]